jgi:hypothetical protein
MLSAHLTRRRTAVGPFALEPNALGVLERVEIGRIAVAGNRLLN